MLARESRIYSGVLDGLIGQGDGAKWTLRNDHSTSLTGAGKILKRREIIIVVNHLGRAVYREIDRSRKSGRRPANAWTSVAQVARNTR